MLTTYQNKGNWDRLQGQTLRDMSGNNTVKSLYEIKSERDWRIQKEVKLRLKAKQEREMKMISDKIREQKRKVKEMEQEMLEKEMLKKERKVEEIEKKIMEERRNNRKHLFRTFNQQDVERPRSKMHFISKDD